MLRHNHTYYAHNALNDRLCYGEITQCIKTTQKQAKVYISGRARRDWGKWKGSGERTGRGSESEYARVKRGRRSQTQSSQTMSYNLNEREVKNNIWGNREPLVRGTTTLTLITDGFRTILVCSSPLALQGERFSQHWHCLFRTAGTTHVDAAQTELQASDVYSSANSNTSMYTLMLTSRGRSKGALNVCTPKVD